MLTAIGILVYKGLQIKETNEIIPKKKKKKTKTASKQVSLQLKSDQLKMDAPGAETLTAAPKVKKGKKHRGSSLSHKSRGTAEVVTPAPGPNAKKPKKHRGSSLSHKSYGPSEVIPAPGTSEVLPIGGEATAKNEEQKKRRRRKFEQPVP